MVAIIVVASVLTQAGLTPMTRTDWGPYWRARLRVRASCMRSRMQFNTAM
jgi:hypothetical protein